MTKIEAFNWHRHLAKKLISTSRIDGQLKGIQPAEIFPESLNLETMKRLDKMNNVSPIAEKILDYDFSRGGHIRDVTLLASNTLSYLWKTQPELFKELIKGYDVPPEQAILYCAEVERLHDILTLPLQGVFHRRLEISGTKYHEDEALLAVFKNDSNFVKLKEKVFDEETLAYYKKVGIEMGKLEQFVKDAFFGKSLLGQLLKKGNECPSFDWISYTVRDFTELLQIFEIKEDLPFEKKISLLVQNLLGVTDALSKNTSFNLPKSEKTRKEITELVPINIFKLVKKDGELKIVSEADVISKIYLMHLLLRLFFSGAPWMQGMENDIYLLFEKRFKNKMDKLFDLILTRSEEELLNLIKMDIDLSKKTDIARCRSVPKRLKGWSYSTIPRENRIKKKFTLKDISRVLVQREDGTIGSFLDIFPSLEQLSEMIALNTPLFLYRKPLSVPVKDPIPTYEFLSDSLSMYAKELYRAGYKHLIPLLDKNYEVKVLNILKDLFYGVMKKFDLPSQPNQRVSPEIEKQIRLEIQNLMKLRGIDKYFDIRIYSPEKMIGQNAPYILKETYEKSTHWSLSDFGKIVLALQEKFPEMTILLVAGRAEDITGSKTPKFKRNESLPAASYRFSIIRDLLVKTLSDKPDKAIPQSDMDLMVVNGPSLEIMLSFLKKRFPGKEFSFVIKQSSRRPFEYIDFGTGERKGIKGRTRRKSWGQIFFPVFDGDYKENNLLITSLMSDGPRSNLPLVLLPVKHTKNGERQYMIWGMTIDPVKGKQDFSRHRLMNQRFLGDPFIASYYPFASKRFLSGSISHLFYAFRHDFRDWGYGGKHPLATIDDRPISEEQLDDIGTLNSLAKETTLFFSRRVIYPIAKILRSNATAIGYKTQRLKNGISILTDLAIGFDGDLASILRVLPAGISFTTKGNKDFFDTNINVYGLGVFDEKGWFPEIGKQLKNPLILNELRKKIFEYVSELEKPEQERKKYLGRKLFYDFLFEVTEGNANKAFELLRPVWCTEYEWKQIYKKKDTGLWEKLLKLDHRFAKIKARL